jgi:hypothetical protein
VRQLQGHLTVANDQKGSRFQLDLPIISLPDPSYTA